MILIFVLALSSMSSFSLSAHAFLDITKHGYEQYQDIIINNAVVKPATGNRRDCSTRYEIIKTVLEKYKRPFTMLDIGASQGYYSFRAAYDHPESTCVMLEGDNPVYPLTGTQLLDLCKCNTELDNIIFLNRKIVPSELQRLSECEHFDVVLVLNIIHWFGDQWQKVADAVLNMGDNIIIESPPQEPFIDRQNNDRRKKIREYLEKKGAKIIGQVPRHTSKAMTDIYLVESNQKYLQRRTWIKPIMPGKTHRIESNFETKQMTKLADSPPNTWLTVPWYPGINLMTFKMYHGAYPTKNQVKKAIESLATTASNDWMPNNMVIQGNNVIMIDTDDPNHNPGGLGGGRLFSQAHLQKILGMIDLDTPKQVEKYFWNTIVHHKK